jgi:predicted Zn-dependent protease
MAAQNGADSQAEFMSTHPSPTPRIANLQGQLPSAQKLYAAVNNKPNCE